MHFFVLGWNLNNELRSRARNELIAICNQFPWLEKSTLWNTDGESMAFAASIQGSKTVTAPRLYVGEDEGTLVLYHGCLIDPSNTFAAWNAHELNQHWSSIDRLEGLYVAAKLWKKQSRLEVQTDPLGVYQVYYVRKGTSWLISNSVRVLRNVVKMRELDPLGVSMFATLGWASGNRTLVQDIMVIPGGQRWVWLNRLENPQFIKYYKPKQVTAIKRRRLSTEDVLKLGDNLSSLLGILATNFNTLECPITGGRDSRLMVALLKRNELPALYFTGGRHDSEDVRIGRMVAETFSLQHECRTDRYQRILEDWSTVRDRLIAQNDGLVSLSCAGYANYFPAAVDSMKVHLYGIGGEIGRAYYYRNNLKFPFKANNLSFVKRLLNNLVHKSDLFNPVTRDLASGYINSFWEAALEDGFSPGNIPDLFYACERVRRWAGTNLRALWSHQDEFSPFCTRPYIETAFSLPLARRQADHIHYQMLHILAPELNAIPYDAQWRVQSPFLAQAQYIGSIMKRKSSRYFKLAGRSTPSKSKNYLHSSLALTRTQILETISPMEREFCLDHSNSPVWDYINCEALDRMLSSNTSPAERYRHHEAIYLALTLVHYSVMQD